MDIDQDAFARRIIERQIKRKLPDSEWEFYRPEAGESLDYVARSLPWIKLYEPEVQALSALSACVTGEATANLAPVIQTTNLARISMFGDASFDFEQYWQVYWDALESPAPPTTDPPFENLSGAWSWIRSELWRGAGQSYLKQGNTRGEAQDWIHTPWGTDVRRDGGPFLNPFLISIRDRAPWLGRELLTMRYMKMIVPDRVRAEYMAKRDNLNWGNPGEGLLAEEISVPICTERIAILAAYSEGLSTWLERVWTQGQCAAFILTGQVADVQRARFWSSESGMQAVIELNGPMTVQDVRNLHATMRRFRQSQKKKEATPEDSQLWNFIERHKVGKTWAEVLEQWNEVYPERRYSHYRALHNAYKRCIKRRSSL